MAGRRYDLEFAASATLGLVSRSRASRPAALVSPRCSLSVYYPGTSTPASTPALERSSRAGVLAGVPDYSLAPGRVLYILRCLLLCLLLPGTDKEFRVSLAYLSTRREIRSHREPALIFSRTRMTSRDRRHGLHQFIRPFRKKAILCIKVRVVQRSIFLSSYGEWALN